MEGYAGQQFVGIDLHRRRSVIVRTTAAGEVLDSVRIVNDAERLAGVSPGRVRPRRWCWRRPTAGTGLWMPCGRGCPGAPGASVGGEGVRLPAGEERRAGRRGSGGSAADGPAAAGVDRSAGHPGAAGAGPAPGQAGRVAVALQGRVHAVLAKCGVQVPVSDLFGLGGTRLLDGVNLPAPYAARIASLRRLLDSLDFEIDLFAGLVRGRLAGDPGYLAVQTIPGVGPVLGAVFLAEIGGVTRFTAAAQLACWAGLTPTHRSPTPTSTAAGSPNKATGWCAGPRWSPCRSCPPPPPSDSCGTGSPPAAAATSVSSPQPAARSSTSTTQYATTTSARWTGTTRGSMTRGQHEPPSTRTGRREVVQVMTPQRRGRPL